MGERSTSKSCTAIYLSSLVQGRKMFHESEADTGGVSTTQFSKPLEMVFKGKIKGKMVFGKSGVDMEGGGLPCVYDKGGCAP